MSSSSLVSSLSGRNKFLLIRLVIGIVCFTVVFLLLHGHLRRTQEPARPCPVTTKPSTAEPHLVPNVVHFIHLASKDFSLAAFVCVLAVHLNHGPDRIVIHTDVEEDLATHPRLARLRKIIGGDSDALELDPVSRPTHVYGSPLGDVSHAADVLRLQLALRHGGIFLDEDTFVVRPLDELRRHEVSLGWPHGQSLGTQFLACKPGSTFVRLWLESYRDYRASLWYYNAGEYPTKVLLGPCPGLVHRERTTIGVDTALVERLYNEEHWDDWRSYYAIHLLMSHRHYLTPEDYAQWGELDERSILAYNKTFGDMARSVLERVDQEL